jgi:hypothetical protein
MHPSGWIYRDLSILDEAAFFEDLLHRPFELIPGTHVAVKHAASNSFPTTLSPVRSKTTNLSFLTSMPIRRGELGDIWNEKFSAD